MTRSVKDIERQIQQAFMNDTVLASAYGFGVGDDFNQRFPKSSVTRQLIYIVAVSVHGVERLMDAFRADIDDELNRRRPHTIAWYCHKALNYQHGMALMPESDEYAVERPELKIVTSAAANEYNGRLVLKVAKGTERREPLSPEEYQAFVEYMFRVKDAGVRLSVVSLPPDRVRLQLKVYYDPTTMLPDGTVIDSQRKEVVEAVKNYVANEIPFNGALVVQHLLGYISRSVAPVVIVEAQSAEVIDALGLAMNSPWQPVESFVFARSGHFTVLDNDITISYVPFSSTV